jgi:hypothetical protein
MASLRSQLYSVKRGEFPSVKEVAVATGEFDSETGPFDGRAKMFHAVSDCRPFV